MNYLTLNYTMRLMLSLGIITFLNSCSMNAYAPAMSPSAPVYSSSSSGSLNRNSVSTAQRIVVKTASMNLDTNNVRATGEHIEQITTANGGHMLSYNERDDKQKSASFALRVPAEKLIIVMDEISQLGKVTYRKITVKDRTKEAIAQKARLAKLKQRQSRLQTLYRGAKNLKDKLELEKTLADIEEEIFSMEEGARQMQVFAKFSKLDISLSQKKIRGPVGTTLDATKWTWSKLFTIRE